MRWQWAVGVRQTVEGSKRRRGREGGGMSSENGTVRNSYAPTNACFAFTGLAA